MINSFDSEHSIIGASVAMGTDSAFVIECVVRALRNQAYALDTETSGLDWVRNHVIGFSFAWRENGKLFGVYCPLDRATSQQVLDPRAAVYVMELLTRNNCDKIGHNFKFDLHFIREDFGFDVCEPIHDTMVMAHLIDESRRIGLKALAKVLIHPDADIYEQEIKQFIGTDTEAKGHLKVPAEYEARYAAHDTIYTLMLYELFRPLIAENFSALYSTEMAMIRILCAAEKHGIHVDIKYLDSLYDKLDVAIPAAMKKLEDLAGHPLNPNSTAQVRQLLFVERKLMPLKFTDGGKPVTSEEILLNYDDPAVNLLLNARTLMKMRSAFVDNILMHTDVNDRVHPRFKSTGTQTGRLSCEDPNMQQIPREESAPVSIRRAFTPAPGTIWAFIDYSQVEMRLLAHFSREPGLIGAFNMGVDIHQGVAAKVFKLPVDKVNSAQRKWAKRISFGINYAIGLKKLATQLRCTVYEAKMFREQYFETFPAVKPFMDKMRKQYERDGYVLNPFGRRRTLPFDKSYRAINTIIQGTAADIIKAAMCKIFFRTLIGTQTKLMLTIHDELVFEIPFNEISIIDDIIEQMQHFHFYVPIEADAYYTVTSWREKRKWGDGHLKITG